MTTTTTPAAASGTFSIGGDLPVHRLGFGAMRVTGRGIWGPPADHDESVRVLRRAVDLGVTFIDTADSYGPNVSEELIAEALHPYPDGLVVATKGGLTRPGPDRWTPNGRPEYLRAQCEGSLKRLKLDRIDLWQLHRIDPAVPADEQFGLLADLVREGKVRHVGLSEVSVDDVEAARRVVPIASVQNCYNIADRAAEPLLEYCEREQIGFIPWSPLVAGRLAARGGALADAARRHDATPGQVALAWLLARSPVMLPIPGTSRVTHLEENVAAAALQLTPDEVARIGGEAGGEAGAGSGAAAQGGAA
ncbi:oxidoreductase [Gemmatimonadetes bacterium T265]|nr:oxidoreductase [Gemmatimonadetes bacterium T265]